MREQITIDVDRTKGSRHARVRVHVAPTPGSPGCAYTVGTAQLAPEQGLDQAAADYLAHALLELISLAAAQASAEAERRRKAGVQPPLPL